MATSNEEGDELVVVAVDCAATLALLEEDSIINSTFEKLEFLWAGKIFERINLVELLRAVSLANRCDSSSLIVIFPL
jgi:hypothetical protein